MKTAQRSVLVSISVAALAPAAFGQTSGPLNASSASVQVPATAVFLEQGTAGTSITANVGARRGDVAFSLGLRSGEGSGDGPRNVFATADGLLDSARVSASFFWSRFRTNPEVNTVINAICNRRGVGSCTGTLINTDPRFNEEDRTELAHARQSDFGGGPTIVFGRLSMGSSSLDLFDERTATTQSQSRTSLDLRFGFGRYLTATGLLAFSFGYADSVQRPNKQNICTNHLVGGMSTTPPTLTCQERYLTGLTTRHNLDLRFEWRQYIGARLAWNPAVTFPWAARDDVATTPTDENVLRMDHVDIESPFYARLGTEAQLHFGVRPSMRIWMGSHASGPVEMNLSFFLGGSFGLIKF